MIRNQNGYWMSPGFQALFAPDGGGGDAGAAGDVAPGGDSGGSAEGNDGGDSGGESGDGTDVDALHAEIDRLKAEVAKQKAAFDKAAHEASDFKKQMNESKNALKAKMTQEEIDAQAKQEADEKAARELEELRKEVAKGKTVKAVMGKLGLDEDAAGNLADHLYGAADMENALLEIQKAWQAREKALRLEYGKVTGPGTGADSNSPEAQAVRRATELGKARKAQNDQAQKAMDAYLR